jgi:ascorbate-specific PTS system EIIC-type component UlaA
MFEDFIVYLLMGTIVIVLGVAMLVMEVRKTIRELKQSSEGKK